MDKKNRKNVANTLKKYRTENSISQEQLASKCKVSQKYISGIENCSRAVSVDIIEKLSLGTGIPSYEFLMDHDSGE